MDLKRVEIAIAGAGMGGLALATMLARSGAKVVLYDQMIEPRAVGSGFVLQPTGLAVLDRLNMSASAHARGAKITHMFGKLAHKDRTVLSIAYGTGRYGIAIQRVALFQILYEAALDSGVRFEASSRVTGVEPGPRPHFITDTGKHLSPADLLVDAMGARSPLRSEPDDELGYGALWATVPWPAGGPFDPNHLEQRYLAARRMAGVLPVGTASDGAPAMATFFWSLRNADFNRWKERGRDAWIEEVSALWPEATGLAEAAEPMHARYRHYTHKPLLDRRIVRIGDAWHATSPQLGQGANMALLDAASLAGALNNAWSIDDALVRHLKQRQMHVRLYQTLSYVLTPFYQSDSRMLPLLRDIVIAPTTQFPILRLLVSRLVTGEFLDPVKKIRLREGTV